MTSDVHPRFQGLCETIENLESKPVIDALLQINHSFITIFMDYLYLWKASIYFQNELYSPLHEINQREIRGVIDQLATFLSAKQVAHELASFDVQVGAELFLAPAMQNIMMSFSDSAHDVYDDRKIHQLMRFWQAEIK